MSFRALPFNVRLNVRQRLSVATGALSVMSMALISVLSAGAARAQDAASNAAAPAIAAPALTLPSADVGQPIPGAMSLTHQVTINGAFGAWLHNGLLMPIMAVITALVLSLLIWVIFRYRRGANPTPSRTSHNTLIEVIWTLVPVLILVVIAVPSISLVVAQYRHPSANAITIKATGNQWYWTYQYPDHGGFEFTANMLKEKDAKLGDGERARTDADGPRLLAVDNRIVVPVGIPVRLLVTSNDVIHSWAVPAFWVKMDGVPGRVNEVSFTVDRPGVYFGQCSELCGARHGFMPIAVEAVPQAQFAQWVLAKGGKMPGASSNSPVAGDVNAAQAAVNAREGLPEAANAQIGAAALNASDLSAPAANSVASAQSAAH